MTPFFFLNLALIICIIIFVNFKIRFIIKYLDTLFVKIKIQGTYTKEFSLKINDLYQKITNIKELIETNEDDNNEVIEKLD